jgi:hypothetical protein
MFDFEENEALWCIMEEIIVFGELLTNHVISYHIYIEKPCEFQFRVGLEL